MGFCRTNLFQRLESSGRAYGFADEELDFILNYDIKYRLGRDTGGEED